MVSAALNAKNNVVSQSSELEVARGIADTYTSGNGILSWADSIEAAKMMEPPCISYIDKVDRVCGSCFSC